MDCKEYIDGQYRKAGFLVGEEAQMQENAKPHEDHLDNAQKYSLKTLRQRMQGHFQAEVQAFYIRYPNLHLEWDFTINAVKKEEGNATNRE